MFNTRGGTTIKAGQHKKDISLSNFVPSYGLVKFSHGTASTATDRRKCCQQATDVFSLPN